ncbi:MAG: cell division protein FtsZ, partial [Desulfovibrionales bacterium]|nr:cell division protein FtsZ [Desulfovibrionales bacterium]
LKELSEYVDSLITIPNEKLLQALGRKASLLSAFSAANDVLLGAVQGIADLIIRPGMINVDFADVRTVMSEMGMAMMGTGSSTGETRASEAAEAAVRSPLLEDIDLQGARGILVNITAGLDFGIGEFEEVGQAVHQYASDNATVVIGTVIDPELADELRVTVVATGLGEADDKIRTVVDNTAPKQAEKSVEELNYTELDRPAIHRKNPKPTVTSNMDAATAPELNASPDYLDIPAFLRRQAD